MWISLSAASGNPSAAAQREQMLLGLTAEQLAKAQAMAALFQPEAAGRADRTAAGA
jgi:hypothetical protein